MVEACRGGAYPSLIGRMQTGWAVMGESQFLRGYSLLLPDPVVPHLNALDARSRDRFLSDFGLLGDAVFHATSALRINYAMFGNVEPALHAHVIPRYSDEAEDKKTAHPWSYDWSAAPRFSLAEHGELLMQIRDRLASRG